MFLFKFYTQKLKKYWSHAGGWNLVWRYATERYSDYDKGRKIRGSIQMKTPTWCNTVQVLFLQGHSTCFGRKRKRLIRAGTALIRRCDDWPATITHVPVAAVLVLNTPDDGRLRPKHVEWPCRNETCTVLHQVGVSFDLYYDARKHKIKKKSLKHLCV